ncbi:MAG: hypothetical protein AAF960_03755 [Bacteroidota bacterium]
MSEQIQIYQAPNGQMQIEVQFEAETVWLTQAQLVTLFHSSKANISSVSHDYLTYKKINI